MTSYVQVWVGQALTIPLGWREIRFNEIYKKRNALARREAENYAAHTPWMLGMGMVHFVFLIHVRGKMPAL